MGLKAVVSYIARRALDCPEELRQPCWRCEGEGYLDVDGAPVPYGLLDNYYLGFRPTACCECKGSGELPIFQLDQFDLAERCGDDPV